MSAITSPKEVVPQKEETPGRPSELLKLLGLLPFMVLGLLWSAAVFLLLWRWFIVPLGVRDITYWHSMGMLLVVGYLTYNAREDPKDRGAEHYRRYIWRLFGYSAWSLALSWLVHLAVR